MPTNNLDPKVDLPHSRQLEGLTEMLGPFPACRPGDHLGVRVAEKKTCHEVQTYYRDTGKTDRVLARVPNSVDSAESVAYAFARFVAYGYELCGEFDRMRREKRPTEEDLSKVLFFRSDRDATIVRVPDDCPIRVEGRVLLAKDHLLPTGFAYEVEVYVDGVWAKGDLLRGANLTRVSSEVASWVTSPKEADEWMTRFRSEVAKVIVPSERSERHRAPTSFHWSLRRTS